MVSKVTLVAFVAVAALICIAQARPQDKPCTCCEGNCDPITASGCKNNLGNKCFTICQHKILAQQLSVSPGETNIVALDNNFKPACKPASIPTCKP